MSGEAAMSVPTTRTMMASTLPRRTPVAIARTSPRRCTTMGELGKSRKQLAGRCGRRVETVGDLDVASENVTVPAQIDVA